MLTIIFFIYKAREAEITISVEMKTPSFPCVFNVDRHRLSQVVHNLVSNAIKFSAEESTVKVSVDVISGDSAENTSHDLHMQNKIIFKQNRVAHYIRFSVTDTGAGISKVTII